MIQSRACCGLRYEQSQCKQRKFGEYERSNNDTTNPVTCATTDIIAPTIPFTNGPCRNQQFSHGSMKDLKLHLQNVSTQGT